MRTSVIVCTRNRLDQVLQFTSSLGEQKEPPSEFVVVDSSDEPIRECDRWRAQVDSLDFPCVYLHTAPGLTHQRNEGVRASTGDILYFFDDDVVLLPDYLQKMNSTYVALPEYVGGMGTLMNLPTGAWEAMRSSYARLFQILRLYGDGRYYRSGFPRFPHGGVDRVSDTQVLSGFLMSYRRSVFEEFSFDPMLCGHSYMEDVDLSCRVSRVHPLFFNPDARLEHRHVARPVDNSRARKRQFLYNHRYLFEKNFCDASVLDQACHWWSILGLFIKAVLRSPARVAGFTEALIEFHRDRKELLVPASSARTPDTLR